MNKKYLGIILLLVIAISGVSAFLITQSPNENNNNNTNSTNITKNESNITKNIIKNDIEFTNHKGKTDKNNVTVTANCQKNAYQGTNATIIWKVTNNGNETIKNVEAGDQDGYHKFGNIAPSESKTYNFTTYIPTNNDLKTDFDMEKGQWPGPLWIGGFSINYSINGEEFSAGANPMEINVKV